MRKGLYRLGLCIMLGALLFLTGCTPYPTDREIYVSNFVLHNLAVGGPLTLETKTADQSTYEFIYETPGGTPEAFQGWWFFSSQGQFGAGSTIYPVIAGSMQTLYAYEYSEAPPEAYGGGLSINRGVNLNYLRADEEFTQRSYDGQQEENIWDGFEGASYHEVKPRERKQFRYGGAYTPASFVANGGVLRLKGPLLGSEETWVHKATRMSKCILQGKDSWGGYPVCLKYEGLELERPTYSIVKNGQLVAEGNVTARQKWYHEYDYGIWSSNEFYYLLSAEAGAVYETGMVIPHFSPTFNRVIVNATFAMDREDNAPPVLESLSASPQFVGKEYTFSFEAADNEGVKSVRVETLRADGSWSPVPENAIVTSPALTKPEPRTTVRVSPLVEGTALSVRIMLEDSSGNTQQYTFLPLALAQQPLRIESKRSPELITPGTIVTFSGTVKDVRGVGVGNVPVYVIYNGKEQVFTYTTSPGYRYIESENGIESVYAEGGDFSFKFDVPKDFSPETSLTVQIPSTGIYEEQEHVISGFAQRIAEDIAVLALDVPDLVFIGNVTVNVSVANVGTKDASARLAIRSVPISIYGDALEDPREIGNREVVLEPGETKKVEVNASFSGFPDYYTLAGFEISAELTWAPDKNRENNNRTVMRSVYAKRDALARLLKYPETFTVGRSQNIQVVIANRGTEPLEKVRYILQKRDVGGTSKTSPAPSTETEPSPALVSEREDKREGLPAFEDIATGEIASLDPLEPAVRAIPVILDHKGQYEFRIIALVADDENPLNDHHDFFVSAQSDAAEVHFSLEREGGRNFIVGEDNNMTLRIRNTGTKAAESLGYQVSVERKRCASCPSDASSEAILVGTTTIPRKGSFVREFTYRPETEGAIFLSLNVSSRTLEKEAEQMLYVFNARVHGADIVPSLWSQHKTPIAGEPTPFRISLFNDGTLTALNASYQLFSSEGCGYSTDDKVSCTSISLIAEEKKLEPIRPSTYYQTSVNVTVLDTGMREFLLVVNASNDIDQKNNVIIERRKFKKSGADLKVYVERPDTLTQGAPVELRFALYNEGTKTSEGGTLSLYVNEKDACDDISECMMEEPVARIPVEVKPREQIEVTLPYTPSTLGEYIFVAYVNATNEADEENNAEAWVAHVLPLGPDLTPSLKVKSEVLTTGAPVEMSVTVFNEGTERSLPTPLSLSYLAFSFADPYASPEKNEAIKQIEQFTIPELLPNGEKTFQASFTPVEIGYYVFVANISGKDRNPLNNFAERVSETYHGAPSVSVEFIGGDTLIAHREASLVTRLMNTGNKDLTNVKVTISVDGTPVKSSFVNISAGDFRWERTQNVFFTHTPRSTTPVSVRVAVESPEEPAALRADNSMEQVFSVYTVRTMNISVVNSSGGTSPRNVVDAERMHLITSATPVPLTLHDNGTSLSFAIGTYLHESNDDDKGAQAIYYEGIPTVPEQVTIVSDYYTSLFQDNVTFRSVFVNKHQLAATRATLVFGLSKARAVSLGIKFKDAEDYTFYTCVSFDSAKKACMQAWVEVADFSISSYDRFFSITAEHVAGQIEAFAIAPSSGFSGATTDVRTIASDKMRNLTVEKRVHGNIVFLPEVNISRFKKNPELLSQHIKFRHGSISVNANAMPELANASASLVFRNLDFKNPRLLYDGVPCPSDRCNPLLYNAAQRTAQVTVKGFSSYTVSEGPYCGDGVCQESCGACVADCGTCPAGDGGAGSEEKKIRTGDGSFACVPQWQCTWGACTNNVRRQTCLDAKRCSYSYGKPAEKQEACLTALSCTDLDGDGYGIGSGCTGLDANDNDPGVRIALVNTSAQNVSSARVQSRYGSASRVIVWSIVALIVLVGVLLIAVSARHRKSLQEAVSARTTYTAG